jgi:hypothetical protein
MHSGSGSVEAKSSATLILTNKKCRKGKKYKF